MLKKGEKPGKGEYICSECGEEQELKKDAEPLKECICGGTQFKKRTMKESVKR